jgi:hypothetical protein
MKFNLNNTLYYGGSNSAHRIGNDVSHIAVELWETDCDEILPLYITEKKTAIHLGSVGYIGRIGWYFMDFMFDDYPDITFDFFKSFYNRDTLDAFPVKDILSNIDPETNDFVCSNSSFTYCENGRFIPEWCKSIDSNCIVLNADPPYFSSYINEQLITGFKLNVSINYYRDVSLVMASANQNRTPILFAYYEPSAIKAKIPMTRVTFPDPKQSVYEIFNNSTTSTFF